MKPQPRSKGIVIYAKIYEQIFDSSLAEDYQVRHVFEDLLKLADQDGTVNRTHEAIARRTNVPLEIIKRGIGELEKPDPRSQSTAYEGRRIVRLDPTRDWGWLIVNHGYYRTLKTADDKRKSAADRQRKHREESNKQQKGVTAVTECDSLHIHTASAFEDERGGEKPDAGHPTEAEFLAHCASPTCGIPPADATDLYLKLKGRGWKDAGGADVLDWKTYCRRMRKFIEQDRGKNAATGNPATGNGKRQAWQIEKDIVAIRQCYEQICADKPFGTSEQAKAERDRWLATGKGIESTRISNRLRELQAELKAAI